jgi:hypothetical protein
MNALALTFAVWIGGGLPAALFVGADPRAWREDLLGCASNAADARAYWDRVASHTADGTCHRRGALAGSALTGVTQ